MTMHPMLSFARSRPARKRLTLLLGIVACIICSLVFLAVFARPKPQALTLVDGTKVQFLGLTIGTNHWNPTTPFLIRALHKVPSLRSVIRYFPRPAGSQPAMAVLSQQGAVLWFYMEKEPLLGQQLVFRCLNKNGENIAGSGNVDFRSATNATPVWLPSINADEASNIRSIEIYLRDIPLSERPINDIFNPISEMDIYPGLRVGEFKIPKKPARP
jgi:hypothetical protein